jgi:hypothetical protein
MIKAETSINAGILVVLSSIPLIAEYVTARPGSVPGTGFNVLCYEPFDYAYFLMAFMILVFANVIIAGKKRKSIKKAAVLGGAIAVAWFIICFIAVAQLHISLGGKL